MDNKDTPVFRAIREKTQNILISDEVLSELSALSIDRLENINRALFYFNPDLLSPETLNVLIHAPNAIVTAKTLNILYENRIINSDDIAAMKDVQKWPNAAFQLLYFSKQVLGECQTVDKALFNLFNSSVDILEDEEIYTRLLHLPMFQHFTQQDLDDVKLHLTNKDKEGLLEVISRYEPQPYNTIP